VDVFIYFYERLDVGLDELEDASDRCLRGHGEVTGEGIGESGSNIDIEIGSSAMNEKEAVDLIRRTLADFDLPSSSRINVEGREYQL